MARASVPVDLLNPGQVFACLGLAETADVLLGGARASWSWEGAPRFLLEASGPEDPVAAVLAFLADAEVCSLSPEGRDDLATERWGVPTRRAAGGTPYPYAPPDSPAALPAVLHTDDREIVVDHWADATSRDSVKFWAGSAGYPGVALLRDALALARPLLGGAARDPFAVGAPQSSSFRFDWRRDYVPIGIGFSLNAHPSGSFTPLGYPLVEVLAAIGLTHARPLRPRRADRLSYAYAVLGGEMLPLTLLRAGLGCGALPFPTRAFRMTLAWPGKEGQARCITDVVEETPT